jgi:hypothetical protein
MATLISINGKTKAVIRKQGYPTLCKTFIKKTDALSWSRRTESEMERGLYIDQSKANTVTLDRLLDRYYQYCQTRQLKALKVYPRPLTHYQATHWSSDPSQYLIASLSSLQR